MTLFMYGKVLLVRQRNLGKGSAEMNAYIGISFASRAEKHRKNARCRAHRSYLDVNDLPATKSQLRCLAETVHHGSHSGYS